MSLESVNKILEKTKILLFNNAKTPNLKQQLELVRKFLDNADQFIKIYQNSLNALGSKNNLKKEVRENKVSCKLLE